jgi:hypothetical protein
MAKIDTTRDFSKYAGSTSQAKTIIINALKKQNLPAHFGTYITRRYGQRIDSVRGIIEGILEWSYDGESKRVRVEYIDGRPQPETKEHPEFYVVWIEGIEPKSGEKILSLNSNSHSYTTSMKRAMRVLPEHGELVKSILRDRGVASWALENCMVKTNYAPSGTIYKP